MGTHVMHANNATHVTRQREIPINLFSIRILQLMKHYSWGLAGLGAGVVIAVIDALVHSVEMLVVR